MEQEYTLLILQEIYRYHEGHRRWPTHVAIPYSLRNKVAPYWLIPLPYQMQPGDVVAKDTPDTLSPAINTIRVECYVDMVGRYKMPQAITYIPPLLGDMAQIS